MLFFYLVEQQKYNIGRNFIGSSPFLSFFYRAVMIKNNIHFMPFYPDIGRMKCQQPTSGLAQRRREVRI
jgi:hypothetical protein